MAASKIYIQGPLRCDLTRVLECKIMDDGLLFAAVTWVAMCIPMSRELWRGYRWPRVTATVVGHQSRVGDPNDGLLLIHLFGPSINTQVNAKLDNPRNKAPFPYCWLIGSVITVCCNPSNPTHVTLPRSGMLVVVIHMFFALPVVAWWVHRL